MITTILPCIYIFLFLKKYTCISLMSVAWSQSHFRSPLFPLPQTFFIHLYTHLFHKSLLFIDLQHRAHLRPKILLFHKNIHSPPTFYIHFSVHAPSCIHFFVHHPLPTFAFLFTPTSPSYIHFFVHPLPPTFTFSFPIHLLHLLFSFTSHLLYSLFRLLPPNTSTFNLLPPPPLLKYWKAIPRLSCQHYPAIKRSFSPRINHRKFIKSLKYDELLK